jgi:hypothetical protein
MAEVIRAVEFYSGLGGLHYGSILFNHLVKIRDAFSPDAKNHFSGTADLLHPTPDVTWAKHFVNDITPTSDHPFSNKADHHFTEEFKAISTPQSTESPLPFVRVVESFDINSVANDVYEYNFGKRPCAKSISDLSIADVDKYKADLFLMSPPCKFISFSLHILIITRCIHMHHTVYCLARS